MSNLERCWPHNTEKEARLAAMSLIFDRKIDEVEALTDRSDDPIPGNTRHHGGGLCYAGDNDSVVFGVGGWFYDGTIENHFIRPIHKNRWLAEKYEVGQKWQKRGSCGKWHNYKSDPFDVGGGSWMNPFSVNKIPAYKDSDKFRPHPEEKELCKWYKDNGGEF